MGKLCYFYISNDSKNDQDSLSKPSEFCDENYDMPSILSLYKKGLEVDGGGIPVSSGEFHIGEFKDLIMRNPLRFSNSRTLEALDNLVYLDSTKEDQQIDVKKQVTNFLTEAKKLQDRVYMDCVFDPASPSQPYLNAFFMLSRDVVFSEYNANLYSASFRKSDFLYGLMSFGGVRQEQENSRPAYYDFSFLNPFAYDTIYKTVAGLRLLSQDVKSDDLLSELRESIFWDSAQSAFKRYIYLDGESHRLNLNRHDSSLTAFPVNKLSSTEEIKPIRLFEKTASYIRSGLAELPERAQDFEVKVCIIGHTEASRCGDESSLMDYIASVLNWYDKLSNELSGRIKPSLKFFVRNIVSAGDWPRDNQAQLRKNFTCTLEHHFAECVIEPVDYESSFGLNTQLLKEKIKENNLIYLLDCPWLSTENFEIKQSGSLDMFCRELSRYYFDEKENTEADKTQFANNVHNFYRKSVFRVLDSQYNRLMASATTKSGEVVRVMRDYLFKRIDRAVKTARKDCEGQEGFKRKIVYVFTSENVGIKYSYLASYPLTRQEKYDGRSHTIIRFSNSVPQTLEYRKNAEIEFQINLWSILKYISVSYAYMDFKNSIKDCLGIGRDEPENAISYFELYRSIIVQFNVSRNLKTITARIRFKDGIDKCIADFPYQSSGKSEDSIKRGLFDVAFKLLYPLYTETVFKANKHYGDDAIKIAFSMNLYSFVNDVNTMLFWHKYRMACQKGKFGDFNIVFLGSYDKELIVGRDNEFLNRDYFMDKKLYDSTMQTLEQTTDMTLGLRGMFSDANVLYKKENMMSEILHNIINACKDAEYTKTSLYSNAKQILMEG